MCGSLSMAFQIHSLRLEEVRLDPEGSALLWDAIQKREVAVPSYRICFLRSRGYFLQSGRKIERVVMATVRGGVEVREQAQMVIGCFFWEGGFDRRLLSSEVPERLSSFVRISKSPCWSAIFNYSSSLVLL